MNEIEQLQSEIRAMREDIEFYRRMEANINEVLDEHNVAVSIFDTPESETARTLTTYERVELLAAELSLLQTNDD
jgi:hypothetical protein